MPASQELVDIVKCRIDQLKAHVEAVRKNIVILMEFYLDRGVKLREIYPLLKESEENLRRTIKLLDEAYLKIQKMLEQSASDSIF